MPLDPLFESSGKSDAKATRSGDPLVLQMAGFVEDLAPWKVIAHHTFAWESSLDSTRRIYEKFMRQSLPTVSHFYAIEENPGRDGHHIHALWDSDEAPRKATWRAWHERYGRNRIEPVRGFDDVVSYCAKYVTKKDAWWNYQLTPRRHELAKKVS